MLPDEKQTPPVPGTPPAPDPQPVPPAPASIYPEPTHGINANSPSRPPVAAYAPMFQEPVKRHNFHLPFLIFLGIFVLLFGLVGYSIKSMGTKTADNNTATTSTGISNAEFYMPAETFSGDFVYKYSGIITLITEKKPYENLSTEYGLNGKNYTLIQSGLASLNDCTLYSSKDAEEFCSKSYKTSKGAIVYPLIKGGAFVSLNDMTLSMRSVDLADAATKKSFDELVDNLQPMARNKLKEYDLAQRKNDAWKKIFSLPFPVYAPASTPAGLPLSFRDIKVDERFYGGKQQLVSIYSAVQNSAVTNSTQAHYTLTQVARPATYDPKTTCTDGVRAYTCTEMKSVSTSPTSTVNVTPGAYKLYKLDTERLLADFGKTLVFIDAYKASNQFKEDAYAAIITSLNSFKETPMADLEYRANLTTAGL